ncbi:MAG: hypothetical protein RL021_822 [Bacteroidota bacterium]|jgi:hypothetical protein
MIADPKIRAKEAPIDWNWVENNYNGQAMNFPVYSFVNQI